MDSLFLPLPACCLSLAVGGMRIVPETWVIPTLEVLPMGWSWNMWFCQSVLESAGQKASDLDSHAVVGHRSHPCLGITAPRLICK